MKTKWCPNRGDVQEDVESNSGCAHQLSECHPIPNIIQKLDCETLITHHKGETRCLSLPDRGTALINGVLHKSRPKIKRNRRPPSFL